MSLAQRNGICAASGHWVTGLTWFWLGTVLDADQSLSDSRLSHCFGWKSGRVNYFAS